jgi:hypothetical protein
VALNPLHRQIIILADEPPIHNLQTLVKRLAIENPSDDSSCVSDAVLDRKQFDSVILDLRCPSLQPGVEVHGIGRIQASRLGRALTLTAEVNGPKTLGVVERFLVNGLPGSLLWLVSHRYKPRKQ